MSLHSDGISEVLKIILLGVILLCLVGAGIWVISEKFPLYQAKKEVTTSIRELANSYAKWSKLADDPVTIDYIYNKQWVILDKETKDHWTFDLIGDPAHHVVAQSLPAMPGGRDKFVWCDIQTGKIWGWGVPETEDSLKAGLIKEESFSKQVLH